MSCKSDVRYNFGKASEHDDIVFGAARPGAVGQRCFNPDDKVTPTEVDSWSDYMASQGIQRVVSLLSESELGTYSEPLPPSLGARFRRAVRLDAKQPGAADALLAELQAAAEAKEKVVVHCWGGGGRTGVALAAWLVRHHGLTPEEAASQVETFAAAQGASRRADVAQLRDFLASAKPVEPLGTQQLQQQQQQQEEAGAPADKHAPSCPPVTQPQGDVPKPASHM